MVLPASAPEGNPHINKPELKTQLLSSFSAFICNLIWSKKQTCCQWVLGNLAESRNPALHP
jgi:hypothetical protein